MARTRTPATVEYFWAEPDPDIVAQQILQLSYALEDFRSPLLAASQIVRADVRERFRTGTDPSGRPWEEWSDNYEPYALKHTTGPVLPGRANLHLTGAMERSLLSPGNWRATEQDLFLDTGGLPEYWAWNNFGAARATAGGAENKAWAEQAKAKGFDVVSDFGENTLPERPFIGTSIEARQKIDAIFAAWFANEVQVATSPKGTMFFRHSKRGAGGRFAPR